MRRTLTVIVLLILVVLAVFADESQPARKTGSLTLYGYYYKRQADESHTVVLSVREIPQGQGQGAKIYHTGQVLATQSLGNKSDVFSWVLQGNFNANLSISFTISALQAYTNDTYFVPQHTYYAKLADPTSFETENSNGGSLTVDLSSTISNSTPDSDGYITLDPFSHEVFGTSPYPDDDYLKRVKVDNEWIVIDHTERTIKYNGNLAPDTDKQYWFVGGTFALNVTSANQSAGVFNYTSNITVEVTVLGVNSQ